MFNNSLQPVRLQRTVEFNSVATKIESKGSVFLRNHYFTIVVVFVFFQANAYPLQSDGKAPGIEKFSKGGPIMHSVSIIELIANPDRYDGQPVRVTGFLRLEFEGDAIYLSKVDFDHALTKNGLWVTFKSGFDQKLSDNYVLIEGTFNAGNQGHLGLWSGSIENITRAELWRLR